MKPTLARQALAMALCGGIIALPLHAIADDIDIFTGASAGTSVNPKILIVLDNTSNWSRQAQKWPDGATQGQSEVNAIKKVIASLNANVNMGLFEFVTDGNANQDGGYVRHAIKSLN